ncbi:hypothetical protein [Rhodoferax sp. BAB1]|uniref:hypothetical protein n=1 Tax=Rhodoferax sp. BAB1 TaxID=2741720 RepID=UPI0015767CC1|nr:hypothetical protein [Rhodoferax sp. BAB1]QKO20655.1 hypothetical protein HTY51_01515 [Rhodoferax sp. BAB1]
MLQFLIESPEVANAMATVASAVLAAVACVVAVISLRVSSKTLEHQQAHNVLSVRPIGSIVVGDYENQLFVKVVNNGVGPLLVTSIRVSDGPEPGKALIDQMPELPPEVYWTNFVEDTSGRTILPGGELMLLDLEVGSSKSIGQFSIARDQVREALGKLSVEVTYSDVYNSKIDPVARDLKWFHRHQ